MTPLPLEDLMDLYFSILDLRNVEQIHEKLDASRRLYTRPEIFTRKAISSHNRYIRKSVKRARKYYIKPHPSQEEWLSDSHSYEHEWCRRTR
jgi:hypothetical protein